MNEKHEQLENLETDPQLDALLDKAFTPSKLPQGLVDNIVAATEGELTMEQRPSVIARIGSSPWLRVAAVIALVVTLAVVVITNNQQPRGEVVIGDPDPAGTTTAVAPITTLAEDVQSYMAAIEQYTAIEAPIDSDLDLLEMDIALAGNTGLWDETTDPFNKTLTHWNDSTY